MTGIPLIIGTRQYKQHLSSRQLFITKPSPSIFKFLGQFHIFWDAETKYQNSGLSWTIRDVWHVCYNTTQSYF